MTEQELEDIEAIIADLFHEIGECDSTNCDRCEAIRTVLHLLRKKVTI
mgnify:CR=1 FL=1